MDCRAVEEKLSAYLDGQLEAKELKSVAIHLETCPSCRAELASLKETIDLVRSLEHVSPPPGLKDKIMGRVDELASVRNLKESRESRGFLPWLWCRLGRRPVLSVAAAAAVLVLALALGRGLLEGGTGVLRLNVPSAGAPQVAIDMKRAEKNSEEPNATSATGGRAPETLIKSAELGSAATSTARQAVPLGRKVVQTGRLVLLVENLDPATDELVRLTQARGGFIQNSFLKRGEGARTASYTLRVPVPAFVNLVQELEKIGEVEQRELGGQDVTEEYVDVEARRRNLERQEERFLNILAQAKTVDDVLKVETQLERVRGEIESLTARLKYLDNQVALATITVELKERPRPVNTVRAFSAANLGTRLRQAMLSSVNALLEYAGQVLVWLAAALPFLLVALVPVAFVWWRKRRRRNKLRN
ncbi:MAG: hypothetical protein PWQ86_1106 [Bacillota bacterium]|nr:hypothetical protein [Bacillota bacterium]MDK2960088.1 hypothetical protein [Bacillota bacterium]